MAGKMVDDAQLACDALANALEVAAKGIAEAASIINDRNARLESMARANRRTYEAATQEKGTSTP